MRHKAYRVYFDKTFAVGLVEAAFNIHARKIFIIQR
jgi:hypothetical protein